VRQDAQRSRAHQWRLALVICVSVLLTFIGGQVGVRLCQEPIDVSGTTRVPGWFSTLKNRDEIAYPAHAMLGDLLNRTSCSPLAAGLQWLKASAHARTEQDVAVAGQGLVTARGRAAQAEAFDAALCGFVGRGFARPQQESVTRHARVECGVPP
jgi:hypothetical protein